MRLQEDFFRLGDCGNGVGLMGISSASVGATSFLRALRCDRQGVVDSMFGSLTEGSNLSNTVFQASVGMASGVLTFSNCIAFGSNNQTATDKGARYGFGLTPTGGTVRLYNSAARWIRQKKSLVTYTGSGVAFGANCEIENVASLANGNIGSTDRDFYQLSTPGSFKNCVSSDLTASGTASHTSETTANTWVSSTDFHPHPSNGSKLINNGVDLSSTWPFSPILDPDGATHDADGYGWEIGPYNFDTSASPDAALATALGIDPTLISTINAEAVRATGRAPEVDFEFLLAMEAARATAVAPGPLLQISASPDPAPATAVAPEIAIALLAAVAPGIADASGRPVSLQIAANPGSAEAIAVATELALVMTANPDSALVVAVAPELGALFDIPSPRVCFSLGITRTEALSLLVSRRFLSSSKVQRTAALSLEVARSARFRRAIARTFRNSSPR